MAALIPPILKYSIVYNLLNFPPILIKFVSEFIVCQVLYFKAQYLVGLRSPLRRLDTPDLEVLHHVSCSGQHEVCSANKSKITNNCKLFLAKHKSRKHAYIILTPLNPSLHSKTGVYRGINYFSYFCSKT